jgi:hypothetical protein
MIDHDCISHVDIKMRQNKRTSKTNDFRKKKFMIASSQYYCQWCVFFSKFQLIFCFCFMNFSSLLKSHLLVFHHVINFSSFSISYTWHFTNLSRIFKFVVIENSSSVSCVYCISYFAFDWETLSLSKFSSIEFSFFELTFVEILSCFDCCDDFSSRSSLINRDKELKSKIHVEF